MVVLQYHGKILNILILYKYDEIFLSYFFLILPNMLSPFASKQLDTDLLYSEQVKCRALEPFKDEIGSILIEAHGQTRNGALGLILVCCSKKIENPIIEARERLKRFVYPFNLFSNHCLLSSFSTRDIEKKN